MTPEQVSLRIRLVVIKIFNPPLSVGLLSSQVEPTWRTGDQFVVHDLQNVLEQDAYKSSHPVSAAVSHPNEIDEIFDSISYGKGEKIILKKGFLAVPCFTILADRLQEGTRRVPTCVYYTASTRSRGLPRREKPKELVFLSLIINVVC